MVLSTGRPTSISWEATNVAAILEAWLPGEEAGNAIADVLFADYNPGGKLPFTIPRSVGQLPLVVYDKPLPIRKYVDLDPTPLYPFGYGLSYTTFRYSNLQLEAKTIRRTGAINVMVDIENTGDRKGDEAALLFVRHLYSSVTRPLKMLKGFHRITLGPAEKKTVKFTLPAEDLALYDHDMRRIVEPGTFRVTVGGLEGAFEVVE